MNGEEDVESLAIQDHSGVELHSHHLDMTSVTVVSGTVVRAINMVVSMAGHRTLHPLHLLERGFQALKVASTQDDNFKDTLLNHSDSPTLIGLPLAGRRF